MIFPRSVHADHLTIKEQVEKVGSEYEEVTNELDRPPVNYMSVAVELWDLIHSCETGLRILSEQHGIDISSIRQYVFEKNRKRGYYS